MSFLKKLFMSDTETIKYQICDCYGDKATPIDWNKLPDDIMNRLLTDKKEFAYNRKSYSLERQVNEKTVVYFRKVSKFKKDITEYREGNIIFGI